MHCFQNSSIWSVYHSDFKERFDFCELSVTLCACFRALYSISLGRHLQCSPLLSRSASLYFTTLHFSCSPWALVAPKMNHAQHFQPRRYLWTKARPSSPSGMFDSCVFVLWTFTFFSILLFQDGLSLMPPSCFGIWISCAPVWTDTIYHYSRFCHWWEACMLQHLLCFNQQKCPLSFIWLRLMLCFGLEYVLGSSFKHKNLRLHVKIVCFIGFNWDST